MRRATTALACSFLLTACTVATACPMCKDSIQGSADAAQAGSLPGGFNTSVYIMLIGFLGTLGLVTMTIVRGVRSTDVSRQSGPDA